MGTCAKWGVRQRVGICAYCWRRCMVLLAQVWKLGWYLRRETATYALQWRRSPGKKPTCAKKNGDLRQKVWAPAPKSVELEKE